ncbi:MAG TPA: hypothetical protein VN673_15250, partial [Clostridia bacterium]|nr:hypothetical protein [Clostridia bacterium]
GVQPNAISRIGQSATFSRLKITGASASIDDTFGAPYALDTTLWTKNAADGTGIFVTAPTGKYWVNWTTPDPGFTTLYCTDNLTNSLVKAQWADLQIPSSQWVTVGDKRLAIVTEPGLNTALPNWNQNQLYFSLFKRVATKLQVLLPGETAAPGTPSGKTGTPTALSAYTFFNVTVNAVDDDWNLVSSVSDTVELTCTDMNAYITPNSISLTGGTGTFADVYFGTAGNFTFTATDKTDTAVAPNTSSTMTSLEP